MNRRSFLLSSSAVALGCLSEARAQHERANDRAGKWKASVDLVIVRGGVTGRSAVVESAVFWRNCDPDFGSVCDLSTGRVPSVPCPPFSQTSLRRVPPFVPSKNLDPLFSFRQQHDPMSQPFRFVANPERLKEELFCSNSSAVHAATSTKR